MIALRTLLGEYFAKVAAYQADALLSIVYWSVIAATALVLRMTRRHLLESTFGTTGSHWHARSSAPRDQQAMSRQF